MNWIISDVFLGYCVSIAHYREEAVSSMYWFLPNCIRWGHTLHTAEITWTLRTRVVKLSMWHSGELVWRRHDCSVKWRLRNPDVVESYVSDPQPQSDDRLLSPWQRDTVSNTAERLRSSHHPPRCSGMTQKISSTAMGFLLFPWMCSDISLRFSEFKVRMSEAWCHRRDAVVRFKLCSDVILQKVVDLAFLECFPAS